MRRFVIAIILISVNFGECFILMNVINEKASKLFLFPFASNLAIFSVQFEGFS